MRHASRTAWITGVLALLVAVGILVGHWPRNDTRVLLPPEPASASPAVRMPLAGDAIATAPAQGRLPVEPVAGASTVPTADPVTGTLVIHVIHGADGTPAAHVGVFLQELRRHGMRGPRGRVETGDDGKVRVSGLRPGRMAVSDDRRIDREAREVDVVAGVDNELTITLEGGIDIDGFVVDAFDRPVAGAILVLAGWAGDSPRTVARADDAGHFRLREISGMANIAARAPGFVTSPFRSVNAGAGARVSVRIVLREEGGSVVGTIVDGGGVPVPDAIVRLGAAPSTGRMIRLPDGSLGLPAPQVELQSDRGGRFTAEGLAPGACPLSVLSERFEPWSGSIEINPGPPASIAITLANGVACTGIVRDESGTPLEGVSVRHSRPEKPGYREDWTDADGSYRLDALPSGTIEIRAGGHEHGNAKTELTGRSGDTLRWDVTLHRGLVLRGVVRGRGGIPVDGALVQAVAQPTADKSAWADHDSTDHDGAFELIDCPSGPVIGLNVRATGYAAYRQAAIDAHGGPLSIDLQWEETPRGRIIGRVVDELGAPVVDAQIFLAGRGDVSSRVFATHADGTIDIEGQRPGVYVVRILAGSHSTRVLEPHTLGEDDTLDLGTIALVVGGRVRVERSGELVAELTLDVHTPDGRWVARVDPESMTSPPLDPGRYELRAGGPTVVPVSATFTIRSGQDTACAIEIRRGSAVQLEFALPAGVEDRGPLAVVVTGADDFQVRRGITRRDSPPLFRLMLGLAPGKYRLRATSSGGHSAEQDLVIEDDAASAGNSPRSPIRVTLR